MTDQTVGSPDFRTITEAVANLCDISLQGLREVQADNVRLRAQLAAVTAERDSWRARAYGNERR